MDKAEMDKVKDKLSKLLALSASPNENEAALAMKKAEELMQKYNLRTVDVAPDGSGAHIGHQEVPGTTRTAQTWEAILGWAIANAFDGQAVRTKGGHWKMTFIAGKSDLEIIVDLYIRVRQTVRRMSSEYVDSVRYTACESAKTLHNNYRMGMVHTIAERLKELKKNTTPVYAGTKDLILVKDKAVDQVKNRIFPKLSKGKVTGFRAIPEAYAQGIADGHSVGLHKAIRH